MIPFSILNSNKEYKANILTLAKPLKLGAKVRPACLDFNQIVDDNIAIVGDFKNETMGKGITSTDNAGKHTLTKFVHNAQTSYNIAGFLISISDTIEKDRVF